MSRCWRFLPLPLSAPRRRSAIVRCSAISGSGRSATGDQGRQQSLQDRPGHRPEFQADPGSRWCRRARRSFRARSSRWRCAIRHGAGAPAWSIPNLAGQGTGAQPAAGNVAPAASARAPQSEPKRVRTVTIKPDQGNEAPAPAPTARASQARSASAAPATVDDILNSSARRMGRWPCRRPVSRRLLRRQSAAQPQRHAARTPANSAFPSTDHDRNQQPAAAGRLRRSGDVPTD